MFMICHHEQLRYRQQFDDECPKLLEIAVFVHLSVIHDRLFKYRGNYWTSHVLVFAEFCKANMDREPESDLFILFDLHQ